MRASLVNRSKNLGFTLIELMVVLIIIAIMSAMVIPEMQGTYEDAILRSASRDMVTVFNTASSRAIAVNQIHRVRFDLKTGHYSVERCVRERLRESEFAPLADVAGSSSAIDPRITLTVHRPGEDPNDTYEKDIFSDPPADEDSMDKTADAPANGIADRAPSMSSAQVVDTLSEDSEASEEVTPDDPTECIIRFYPDGTADARQIFLEDRAGFRLALQINPFTSRVEILNAGRK